jgi:prophage maintenance system killer protein
MYEDMREFPEINYSELARERISEYLAAVKNKETYSPNNFLSLKDLIFSSNRIIQIHDKIEKNNAKMKELDWVESVFELDLFDSMSNVLYNFARIHPFEDGNKRTAFICVDSFLRLNYFKLKIDAEKNKTTEDEKFFWQNSNRQKTLKEIKEFLISRKIPSRKPKHVEQAIDDSIQENKQLLENLAK